jgi:hypothetical protein
VAAITAAQHRRRCRRTGTAEPELDGRPERRGKRVVVVCNVRKYGGEPMAVLLEQHRA